MPVILAWLLITAIGCLAFSSARSPEGIWIQRQLHSSIEAAGSILAALVGAFLLIREQTGPRLRWVASGFLGMAVLDGFHASAPDGNLCIYFRTAANFIGGAFAFLAWAVPSKARSSPWLPRLAIAVALALGVFGALEPRWVPAMRVGLQFSSLAVLMNVAGGVFFLFGANAICREQRCSEDPFARSIAVVVLLFAVSGLLFRFSELWDLTWWLWHWVRLSSFALVFASLLSLFRANLRELALANELKTRFMNIASHELRTPLTALSLRIDLLERMRRERAQPVGERDLAALRSVVARLKRMVSELLDVSLLERDMISLQRAPIHLKELLSEACAEFRQTHADRRIETDFPEAGDFRVDADPVRIVQVIENLLSNAAKYSNPETPIRVALEASNDALRIRVSDSGPGISPGDLEKIFEPYYRSAHTRTDHVPGLGLGLYISRQIAQLHGGDLEAVSEKGVGSRFTLVIPRPSSR